MADMTIGEMQKNMDQVSEDIGQAQGASEEKLTALKLRANAMEPDGSVVTPEKALLIADSVINPEVKRMISDFYTVYRQALELKATRESMQRTFEARIKAAIEDGRSAAESKGIKGGGKGRMRRGVLGCEDDEPHEGQQVRGERRRCRMEYIPGGHVGYHGVR